MPPQKTALATNPVREVRLSRNRTLREFASDIGVHYQAVYLNESGVYPYILPRIKKYLTQKLGLDGRELDLRYSAFVYVQRCSFEARYAPYSLPEPLTGDSPIVRWRESLGLTQSALAKALCIQPVLLSKVENKRSAMIPSQMLEALRDIKFPKELIEELEYRVEDYYYS